MRCLIVLDSSKTDFIFLNIVRQLRENGHEVGVYDVSGKTYKRVSDSIGCQIYKYSELSDAVVEYYEVAFCMYKALPFARKLNIYVFSFCLGTDAEQSRYSSADFLFSADDIYFENAYMPIGVPVSVEEKSENTERMNLWIDEQSGITLGGICAIEQFVRERVLEKNCRRICIYVENAVCRTFLADKFAGVEEVRICSDTELYDLTSEIMVFSDKAYIQAKANGMKPFFCEEEKLIRKQGNWHFNPAFYDDIIRISEFICAKMLTEGVYPKAERYLAETVLSQGMLQNSGLSMEDLVGIRNKNYLKEKVWVGCFPYQETKYESTGLFVRGIGAFYAGEYESAENLLRQYLNCVMKKIYAENPLEQWNCVKEAWKHLHYAELFCGNTIEPREMAWLMAGIADEEKEEVRSYFFERVRQLRKQNKRKEVLEIHHFYDELEEWVSGRKSHMGLPRYVFGLKRREIKEKISKSPLKEKVKWFCYRAKRYLQRKLKLLCVKVHIYSSYEKRILKYQGKYQGERCFIIGNGPSLKVEDLDKLEQNGEYCFACNKIYKVYGKTKWRPDFYACTDSAVFGQNYVSILNQKGPQKFFSAGLPFQNKIRKDPENIVLNYATKDIQKTRFNPKATYIFSGGSVTYVLINLAWALGFREIYLIGCDHSYGFFAGKTQNSAISTAETNQDYFMKNYMRPGEKINIGDLDRSSQGYTIAKNYIESHGGRIYNATRGGKLEVFERVDLDKILNDRKERNHKK